MHNNQLWTKSDVLKETPIPWNNVIKLLGMFLVCGTTSLDLCYPGLLYHAFELCHYQEILTDILHVQETKCGDATFGSVRFTGN